LFIALAVRVGKRLKKAAEKPGFIWGADYISADI